MKNASEEKRYYNISEVAEKLGIEASTLRYWESQFPTISPRRNDNKKRFYTEEDIENVRMVQYLLKQRNLTIKGAKLALEENKGQVERLYEAARRLESIREEVKKLKAEFGTALKKTITIEEL